jgi:hypothetical protein
LHILYFIAIPLRSLPSAGLFATGCPGRLDFPTTSSLDRGEKVSFPIPPMTRTQCAAPNRGTRRHHDCAVAMRKRRAKVVVAIWETRVVATAPTDK